MVSTPYESWTVQQVAAWLTGSLELPQKLADEFVANAISGAGDCWCYQWDSGSCAGLARAIEVPGTRLVMKRSPHWDRRRRQWWFRRAQ